MVKYGVKAGDRVGIVGIGGLGHLAIQFASALGAEVVAISRSSAKHKDAIDLGATRFVHSENREETRAIYNTLKFLFVTGDCGTAQLNELIHLVDIGGQIVILALSKETLELEPFILAVKQVSISGNLVGGVSMIKQTLEFAAKHGIRPVIERYPMAKVNEALEHANAGRARYRLILEN
ncbi:hypothetical protein EC988_000806 [Linderina pennispora]|nr:hypothetical protein EC988_000806 [Linderina pennispora]